MSHKRSMKCINRLQMYLMLLKLLHRVEINSKTTYSAKRRIYAGVNNGWDEVGKGGHEPGNP
jgi:hypothetical protein